MKENKTENIYERIAKEYMDYNGEMLQRESQSLPPFPDETVNRLDNRVASQIRALKIRRFTRLAGLAAACLLLVLAVPLVYLLQNTGNMRSADSSSESAAAESSVELIPLSFSLPDNFTVSDSKTDNGVSVYYLADTHADDVVLQLEYTDTATPVFDSLKPVTIAGNEAYGYAAGSFKMVSFIHGDILYTLTCKYDINTLISISENIF
ncbi:MAG: hypothetical protein ACRC3H_21940 [Lachnospiraceae bacterium]